MLLDFISHHSSPIMVTEAAALLKCLIYLVSAQVGEDEFGYMLANILKENNVNNEGMRFDPGARTALAFVTLRKDGEREFMFYRNPSADMLLQEAELDLELIRKVTAVILKKINIILNIISVNVISEGDHFS